VCQLLFETVFVLMVLSYVVSVVLVVTTLFYLNTNRASHDLERKTFCSTRLFRALAAKQSLSVGVMEFRYV
jgi:hypothetical protein